MERTDEYELALETAAEERMPKQLRRFFAHILLCCGFTKSNGLALWERFQDSLSEDYFHDLGDREVAMDRSLQDLQRILETAGGGRRLTEHFGIPEPQGYNKEMFDTKEIRRETLAYDISEELRKAEEQIQKLHESQLALFKAVMQSVDEKRGGVFFADGPGGTGKTYVEQALLHKIRSRGEIALACAWSGVAATLLEGGRTCHATFGFPVPLPRENVGSSIKAQQGRAQVLRAASLIIWDEAPMSPTEAVSGADMLLRDLCESDLPFAGKTVLFSGDFRQVLPVMPHTSRADIVAHSIKNHYAMSSDIVEIHHLSFNHRANQDAEFAKYLLRIGDGVEPTEPTLSSSAIKLPGEIVAPEDWTSSDLLDEMFPNFVQRTLACAEPGGTTVDTDFFKSRAVLSPKNVVINEINDDALGKLEAVGATITTYLSVDNIQDARPEDAMNYPQDFLHSLNPSGLPPHELRLTPGAVIIVLRNIDSEMGLVNGCRCIVKRCLNRYLDVLVLTGRAAGQRVYIPRIPMAPKVADLPFILSRRQFPVRLAWAMTINKAQGQSLERSGLVLPEPVFAHGQLYVALSRVGAFHKVKVLISKANGQGVYTGHASIPNGTYTQNIVWDEALLHHREQEGARATKRNDTPMGCTKNEDGAWTEFDPDDDTSAAVHLAFAHSTVENLATEVDHDTLIPQQLAVDGLSGFEQLLHDAHSILEPSFEGLQAESVTSQSDDGDRSDTDVDPSMLAVAPQAVYPLLFETQQELRCGRHALNNAFGGIHTFTDGDLTAACEALVAESMIPDDNGIISDPQTLDDHMSRAGWYSNAALGMALRRTFHYELQMGHQLRLNLNALEEVAVIGAVTNKRNTHWVALKLVDGRIWLLDSLEEPKVLDAASFRAFVNKFPHIYAIRHLNV